MTCARIAEVTVLTLLCWLILTLSVMGAVHLVRC